jgi:N-acetylmuramoyl-L-alanine amidase
MLVQLFSPIKTYLHISLTLCLAYSGIAQAASNLVTASRVWPAQDYTRITLEATNAISYKVFFLKNPDRIVMDIDNVELNSNLKSLADKIAADDPNIKQVRVAANKPGVVRLVVDLKAEAKPSVNLLLPAGEYKHRLVLDIFPVKDPLMALLEQRDNSNATTPEIVVPKVVEPEPNLTEPAGHNDAPQGFPTAPTISNEPSRSEHKLENNDNYKYSRQVTIALDAGHGGEDPGARGANGSNEKDITLAIVKKLKAKIDEDPGMRAVLTRDGDYFIPLHGRVVKARKLQADLFVSIHADSFTNSAARGSSVFALSERGATSASARYLAKKEDESDLIGGVSLAIKDPFLARTLLDLSQTATINDSLKLGKSVLGQIGEINTLHKNRVEQAAFAVLKSPDIPSILVETAFISNPDEERKLGDDAYQDKLVMSIYAGIKKYFSTNPALAKSKLALE